MISNGLKYFNYNKKAYLTDGVQLVGDDTEVSANEMVLDADANVLTIGPPFEVAVDDYNATADGMTVDIDNEVTV